MLITKVWHPRRCQRRHLADILKSERGRPESPSRRVFPPAGAALRAGPSYPQDAVVARQYIDEQHKFVEQARAWTAQYATENARDEKLEIPS